MTSIFGRGTAPLALLISNGPGKSGHLNNAGPHGEELYIYCSPNRPSQTGYISNTICTIGFPTLRHTSNGPHSLILLHSCYTQDTQGAPTPTQYISQDIGSVTLSVAHQHPYSLPTVFLSQSPAGLHLLSPHSTTTNKHPQPVFPLSDIPQQTSPIHRASTLTTQTRQSHHSPPIPL